MNVFKGVLRRMAAINLMAHLEPCIYLFQQAFCHPLQSFPLVHFISCEVHLSWRSLAVAQLLLLYGACAKTARKTPGRSVSVPECAHEYGRGLWGWGGGDRVRRGDYMCVFLEMDERSKDCTHLSWYSAPIKSNECAGVTSVS